MVEPQSDSAGLLARVALQDRRALEQLYERHAGTALAIAKRLVGRISEAEDVVQEAFVEIWRRADHYDARRGTGEAWIFGIVRNRAIDKLRHRTVVLRVVGDAGREQLAREQATVTPLEEASQRQARLAVVQALQDLPAEQRASLELAYYEGLSHSEIAQRTGEPLGTVKTRIRSAMEKLSKLLRSHA
jgi:RNA polymerase sigma-70 factor (ECF subfamily)